MKDEYININKVAEAKGLKSNRSLRIAIQKGKYIAREVTVFGGTSYEILYSSLEVEVQEKLENEEIKSTALVPLNNTPRPSFISESARLTALAKVDIINALENLRNKYPTKKEADSIFIDLYNSGQYLPQVYNFLGSISIGTVKHYLKLYKESGEDYRALIPNYKVAKQGEYNSILTDEMKKVFINYLLHPNKFKIGKAITLTMHILEKRGIENIPCKLSFRRYAEHFKKNNYAKWVLMREGEKAYHDKVEPYIERDISKIEVGDVIIADGHVLNFQVINPFTGKPTRATLVGFLDWKSTALVGYEIMMTENTQCIASALRNSILNLGVIPKVVYQDNGRAFKSKYFQHTDFDEEGFNGVYANLGIHSVFAKPYNARAKVIERFFLEFQEEFEKMMPSYIGTSIENRPAHLNRNEKLHKEMHKKLTGNKILTVQEAIQFINCWLDFHNSKPCPNNPQMTIKQVLNTVQKQDIDINILNDLMMKTEVRTINKHGITFLNMHYRSDCLLGLRDKVYVRYSLFDLSKLYVYSVKGEFLCVARRVQKVHPMANVLGTVKDIRRKFMEENNRTEEKELRRFYAENILRNVYGLKGDLSTLLSNFINSFYEHFFQNFDYEKAKHIRNAQSNLIGMSSPNKTDKVTFYVGLMDKDTLTYNYSIEESINKVFQIFGECSVFSCKGSFTNKYGKFIVMDSLQIVLYRKNVTNEYIYLKAKELKKFFNQDSILTEITNSVRVELNDEPDSYEEEIHKLMKEYDWSWDVAVQAYNSGLF